MARLIIYPLNLDSAGATELKDVFVTAGINAKKVRPDGTYSYKTTDTILGWGNSQRPNWHTNSIPYINHPDRIAVCANKTRTFQCLGAHVPTPEWTTDRNIAKSWIDQGHTVMVRQKVTGSGGEGIIVAKVKEEVVDAPLYTKYFPRKHEYRVHIMVGKNGIPVIIDFAQKKKSTDFTGEVNKSVRTHQNGWIFAKQDVVLPAKVKDVAKKAVKQLGMDLASVDVGYNESEDLAVVFECNSASGIEASTVDAYYKALRSYMNNQTIVPAPGSEVDAPLNLGAATHSGAQTAQHAPQAQPAHTPAPSAQTVASVATSISNVIKISQATNIEVIKEGSYVSIYGVVPGMHYPQRLAKIEGTNLSVKKVEV